MGDIPQIDPEEVSGHVDHFTKFEGNIAFGSRFDLAAIGERSEGVLFAAFAFEPVIIVLAHFFLQDEHEPVGNGCQHVLGTVRTDSDQFSVFSCSYALPADACQLS